MKNLILSILILSGLTAHGQELWNHCGSSVTVQPTPSYDSTFVLSAPSRAALAKGMANWVPATSGDVGYTEYVALLTQSGTDAPVATVLSNTLGGSVTWGYIGAGDFSFTLPGIVDPNKIYAPPILVNDGGVVAAWIMHTTGNDFEMVGVSNSVLSGTPIIIRVYP